jgi:two-component system OmpR family sensor kinase
MGSLRARIIAGVLPLVAIGLLVLAAITYAEQRSFLLGQVDQQLRSSINEISQFLDQRGYEVLGDGKAYVRKEGEVQPGSGGGGPGSEGREDNDDGTGAGRGPLPALGARGARLTPAGALVGEELVIGTSHSRPAIPKDIPLGEAFTVGAVTGSGQYRVYAQHDPEDPGITYVAIPLTGVTDTLHRLLVVEAIVIGAVLLVIAALLYAVIGVGLRPLRRFEDTAEEVAGGRMSERVSPADERSEVGRLGLALNAMLDRLEAAFDERDASEERLRQFLADASHELRTPIAAIRGYAELYRIGAASDPENTGLAMRRIEQEASRMGVLVEDLLVLARLDEEPEREPVDVDLAPLVRDAASDAHAMAPDRSVSADADGPILVRGNPMHLHQVLANLIRNAIVHTPEGSPIELGARADGREAVITVRDHGPGVPPENREQLFDRFWRAEKGRERGRAGAGLGLAIVAAIVDDAGGSVAVGDAPGGGAIFSVRLPLAQEAAAPVSSQESHSVR